METRPPALRALNIDDLNNIPPRARRGVSQIAINAEPVKVRGEALSEVWWRGKQWAVTAFGIELLDGTYHVEASRLAESPEYPWPMHLAEKTWVDVDDFTTAWMIALLLHGKASEVDPVAVRGMFASLRPTHQEMDDEIG